MAEPREFHIGDILSVTTGRLLSPRLMTGVYDILDFMTQDRLFTHQLPRACDECAPHLLRLHPALADVDVSEINGINWRERLDALIATFGETLPVTTLPDHAHEYIDPVSEIVETVHPSRVVIIQNGKG